MKRKEEKVLCNEDVASLLLDCSGQSRRYTGWLYMCPLFLVTVVTVDLQPLSASWDAFFIRNKTIYYYKWFNNNNNNVGAILNNWPQPQTVRPPHHFYMWYILFIFINYKNYNIDFVCWRAFSNACCGLKPNGRHAVGHFSNILTCNKSLFIYYKLL